MEPRARHRPALAGIAIATGGYALAFAINTVSFLAVIAAVAPLRLPAPHPTPGESIRRSISSGARFAWGDRGIRAIIVYIACNSLLAAPFIALVPAVALRVFHHGASGTALLVTAQGLGAVAMALSLGGLAYRFGQRRTVLANITLLPAALVAYAAAPTLALGAVAIFAVGATYLGCLSSFTTIAQLRAPPQLRGRVLSALMVLLGLLYPLGSVVQGALADTFGLRAVTAATAVLLAVALLAIRTFRRGFDRDLDDLEPRATSLAVVGAVAPGGA